MSSTTVGSTIPDGATLFRFSSSTFRMMLDRLLATEFGARRIIFGRFSARAPRRTLSGSPRAHEGPGIIADDIDALHLGPVLHVAEDLLGRHDAGIGRSRFPASRPGGWASSACGEHFRI